MTYNPAKHTPAIADMPPGHARPMTAERALVIIHKNCVALANDDDPEVKAARELAIHLEKGL